MEHGDRFIHPLITHPFRFFRTGDLGRMEDGMYLYITGRIKEQYKLENGKYVVPGPIEAAMTSSTYITQVGGNERQQHQPPIMT